MAREWASLGPGEQQRSLIDQVWVYGDPTVHNLARTGEGPQVLARATTPRSSPSPSC